MTYYIDSNSITVQAPASDQGYQLNNASFNGNVITIENGYAARISKVNILATNLPNFGDENIFHNATGLSINYAGITLPSDQPAYLKLGLQFEHKVDVQANDDGTHLITGLANDQQINSYWYDTMTGGGVHEVFVFKPHFGQDEITDFILGGRQHDVISLSSSEFSSVAEVLQHTQDVNGSAVIHVTPHDTITVDGVSKADLVTHPHDIMFHP